MVMFNRLLYVYQSVCPFSLLFSSLRRLSLPCGARFGTALGSLEPGSCVAVVG